MSPSQRILLGFSAMVLLLAARPARSDYSYLDFDIIDDVPEKFKASGTLTGVDESDPPVAYTANIADLIQGDYWKFYVYNSNGGWQFYPFTVDNGSWQTRVYLYGEHEDGPHATDDDPNLLGLVNSDTASAAFNAKTAVSITAYSHVPHPAGPRQHWDVYSIRHNVTALQGPDHMITGPFEIKARHTNAEAESTISHELIKLTIGSSSAAGAKASYNAASGILTIHFGAIDILNSTGSIAAGIEAQYAGDPVLNGSIGDVTIPYFGPTGGGGYRFGGGPLALVDPEGDLTVRGGFSEYVVYNTSRTGPFDSFGIFDNLSIVDDGSCPSPSMDDFADKDVMGESISDDVWLALDGVGFVLVTSQNLATLTGGFAFSAFDVPATVAISAIHHMGSVAGAPTTNPVVEAPIRSYPNPFQARTTIWYRVNQPGSSVRVEIFEPGGRLVRRLVESGAQDSGDHTVEWDGAADDGRRVSSGIYFYRVTIGNRTFSDRLMMVR